MGTRPRVRAAHASPSPRAHQRALELASEATLRGDFEEAIRQYRRILERAPGHAEVHNDLANAYRSVWRMEDALEHYRAAVRLKPELAMAQRNLGLTLLDVGRAEEALEPLEAARRLRPDHAPTLHAMMLAQVRAGRGEEALAGLEHFRLAAETAQGSAAALADYALALSKFDRMDETAEILGRAIELGPADAADLLVFRGLSLQETTRYAEARECFERAIALRPEWGEAHFHRATELLRAGDFPAGFAEYEWRWRHAGFSSPRMDFDEPLWDGSPLEGRTLLLHTEQGLGDSVQFIRFARRAAEMGGRVVVLCEFSLVRLFAGVPGIDAIVSKGDLLPAFDVHAPLLSLPRLLGVTLEEVKTDGPYLSAGPGLPLPARRPGTRARIGIAWAGSRGHVKNRFRSIPLSALDPILDLPDLEIVSLQRGHGQEQLAGHPAAGRISDLGSRFVDLQDAADAIAQLDLVITVDTSIAHLAGALGRPTWLLLPFDADWRWMTGREDTPWYPSVRLFRCASRGDWAPVMRRMVAELGGVGAAKESSRPMSATAKSGAQQRFAAAVRAHLAGDESAARTGYEQVLSLDPRFAEAHSNLGVIVRKQESATAAIPHFERALALNGRYAEARNNLGLALMQAGRPEAATEHFRALVEQHPDHVDGLNNLGLALRELGEFEAAVEPLRAVVRLQPDNPEWLNNLANVLLQSRQTEEAMRCYERALALRSDYPEALNNLGAAYRAQREYEKAVPYFLRALELRPDYHDALYNLALSLPEGADLSGHEAVLREAAERNAADPRYAALLALFLQESARFADAEPLARAVLERDPGLADTWSVLGVCRAEQGDFDEAVACYRRAIELESTCITAHWNLSLAHLMRGEYAQGWEEYEWRWKLLFFAYDHREATAPAWTGESLDGKTILLLSEQGFGDGLMFLRFARELKKRWKVRIIAETRPPLASLFRASGFVDEVTIRGDTAPAHDFEIPLLGTPRLLGVTLENLPAEPYLVAGRRPVQKLIEDGPEVKVGLVWGGRTPNANLARRSLDLDVLGPLLATPGARFYSLQKGEPAKALAASVHRDRIVDLGPALDDFLDTAAAIERLDLVITIDTAVAHLAGAMGKPVWVLLMEVSDWRWLLDRDDSPWYPSARLFRQTGGAGWDPVVERVADALRQATGDESFPRATPPAAEASDASDAGIFLDDELRPGDGLLQIGASEPTGMPGVTLVAAPDLASLDLATLAECFAACRRVFLRVDAAEEVPGAVAACGELLASARLAAVLWPDLADGGGPDAQRDGAARRHQIVRGTLGGFGFRHFRVDHDEEGPILNPWSADRPAQTIVSLAPEMVPGADAVLAETAAPATPGRAQIPLGFDWQLGASSGWGVYGLNLALHAPAFGVLPHPLSAPDLRAVSPLQAFALAPMLGGRAEPPRRNLRALGNGLRGATIEGSQRLDDIGVVFFEDTALDAAALARGRRFQRIVAGSTWNAEVLRGHGLRDVAVAIQGVDPTVFHPAPSSGLFADRFVVFSGGKLEYRKGQDLVVAAFREFHRRHPDSVLMIAWHNHWPRTMAEIPLRGHVVGIPTVDPQGRMNTRGWLATNGIPESAVIDLGLVPNGMMGQILREAHVGLFPNRCEGGTNLVAMECMASGVPTILSANTGHLDLVSDERCYPLRRQQPALPSSLFRGVDGWGESDVEEMVEALEEVYQRRADAAARGDAAARFMTGFSWRNQIGALLDSIADLL